MEFLVQERDYFEEINNYLVNYGIKFLEDDNQRYRLNHEIRKLEPYIAEQFEGFWTRLLETIKDNLNSSGTNVHFSSFARLVQNSGGSTHRSYDVSGIYIYRVIAEMERQGKIEMVGRPRFFKKWQYRFAKKSGENYVFRMYG